MEILDNLDGTGVRHRPNREPPFFIQDPDDPLRFLFMEEILAMIAAEGKWLADRNPGAAVEELRTAALSRPRPYARMMRRFPYCEDEFTMA